MGKTTNLILVAAGSFIAGVLLAPKSGKRTREELRKKAAEYKGKASDGLEEVKTGAGYVKEEFKEGAESMKGIAKDAMTDVKRSAGRMKKEAAERTEAVKKNIRETSEDVEHTVR